MTEPVDLMGIYLHLVRASGLRGRLLVQDRLLVLAGVLAAEQGLAANCRLLSALCLGAQPAALFSPLVNGRGGSGRSRVHFLSAALASAISRERAERMLDALGIERGCERAAYYSDEEYAAALLGIRLDQLEEFRGEDAS